MGQLSNCHKTVYIELQIAYNSTTNTEVNLFFKVTETCTIDSSDRYTNGEVDVNFFEAESLSVLDSYFKDLSDYNLAHGLRTVVEIVADEDLDAEMEANDCFNAMDPTRL